MTHVLWMEDVVWWRASIKSHLYCLRVNLDTNSLLRELNNCIYVLRSPRG
jgi:hypothetical protein